MDKKTIMNIKDNYDQKIDQLMTAVESLREVFNDIQAMEYIQELSTEILQGSDEYTEELDEAFHLSLFKNSAGCDVCWIIETTKEHARKFINELDEFIQDKIKEDDEKESKRLELPSLDDFDEDDFLKDETSN